MQASEFLKARQLVTNYKKRASLLQKLSICRTLRVRNVFEEHTPGTNVIKLFLSVIYGFSYQAIVFVRLGNKSLPMANTL